MPGRRQCLAALNVPAVALLVAFSFMVVRDPQLVQLECLLCQVWYIRSGPMWPDSFKADSNWSFTDWQATQLEQLGAANSLQRRDVVVHQTVRSLDLSPQQQKWQDTWRRLGFNVTTADDLQARRDVLRLVQVLEWPEILRVYDALETSVQRSDVWRYAILWLDGGVYADIDVYAYPPMKSLVYSSEAIIFSESLPVFEWLPHALSVGIGQFARLLGLTDLVRLPQRRNCLMVAPPRHPLMLRTLKLIVAKMHSERNPKQIPEPTRTLELTGPGVFTDALDELLRERDAASLGLTFVSRIDGLHYFCHVAQGSWKKYLDATDQPALKPHEQTLRWCVVLLQTTGLAVYWLRSWRSARKRLWRQRLVQHFSDAQQQVILCVWVWAARSFAWMPVKSRGSDADEGEGTFGSDEKPRRFLPCSFSHQHKLCSLPLQNATGRPPNEGSAGAVAQVAKMHQVDDCTALMRDTWFG